MLLLLLDESSLHKVLQDLLSAGVRKSVQPDRNPRNMRVPAHSLQRRGTVRERVCISGALAVSSQTTLAPLVIPASTPKAFLASLPRHRTCIIGDHRYRLLSTAVESARSISTQQKGIFKGDVVSSVVYNV